MTTVEITPHLYRYFPQLKNRTIRAPAGSVAQILRAVDEIAPGFKDYLLDDQGRLRRHVHISINDTLVVDRKTLSDRVPDGGTLYIFQALSGG
ncbi:MoaD/ThiS family protein [Marinobacterium arenosum]|uniref:MoaD/ThiS family protein n=1 Tax=Marinobacterium arenosum TaxID=2862496 RepID=UPI002104D1CB|nr:MoaD/ThiS family protein [Marinobacterium arenosum]